ncbi:MAG: DUF2922 domain-containing protein [Lactobacillus sp.]|nr:DUF2922 domain-containing protein [Lactobacillus sp.]MDN6043482.1 DUF2922 domain-containing protein [Lactobacillus sp.]MDN6052514.1 DUF2922 domain-containing protein [Lactobacillus sp.]
MTTTKTLRLVFLNGAGKQGSWSLPALDNLEEPVVVAAMKAITQANIFAKRGVDLYQTPKAAEYIERTVTGIFGNHAD